MQKVACDALSRSRRLPLWLRTGSSAHSVFNALPFLRHQQFFALTQSCLRMRVYMATAFVCWDCYPCGRGLLLPAVLFQEGGSTGYLAGGGGEVTTGGAGGTPASPQGGIVPMAPPPTFFSGKFIAVILFSFGSQCHCKIAGARSTTFGLASANALCRMCPPVCW